MTEIRFIQPELPLFFTATVPPIVPDIPAQGAAETPATDIAASPSTITEAEATTSATVLPSVISEPASPTASDRAPSMFIDLVTPPPTFAQVIDLIPTWTDLSDIRRRDLISAMKGAARIAGATPQNLLCDTQTLNGQLFNRPPAAVRMRLPRFRSILSAVRFVLRRIGRHIPAQPGESMLGEAWTEVFDHLPENPMRAGLRNLARWCDARSIDPIAVDDEVLAAFIESDRASRLAAATGDQGPSLARAWNKAIGQQPTPERFTKVAAPRKREPYTFPISAYPQLFQDDVAHYRAAVSRIARQAVSADPARAKDGHPGRRFVAPAQNPFTGTTAAFRKLKPTSVESRVFSIRQAAAALHRTGTPLAEITSLRDLVWPLDHPSRILQFHLDRIDREQGGQLGQIAETLRQIAKHHVDVPPECLEALTAWAKDTAEPKRGEMGPKARACLLAMIQRRPRAMLLALPKELVETSKSGNLTPIERAMIVRSAVVIELLIVCPARISNIQGIRIDRNLARLNGPNLPSHLMIQGDDVKNVEPIQWPIPVESARLIQGFIDIHRSHLAEPGNPYLLPGRGQAPLSVSRIRQTFQDTIDRAIGIKVYPHAMRHFAAWQFLTSHPGQYEMVRRLLGHRDVRTTERFYCGLEGEAAAKLFDEAITKDRKNGRLIARVGFRRVAGRKPPVSKTQPPKAPNIALSGTKGN